MKTTVTSLKAAGLYSVVCPECHRMRQVRFNELVLIPANGKMPYQLCPDCKEIKERRKENGTQS